MIIENFPKGIYRCDTDERANHPYHQALTRLFYNNNDLDTYFKCQTIIATIAIDQRFDTKHGLSRALGYLDERWR